MIFYKTQWACQGVKLIRLMSIFTSKKVWKFLIKIQLTKSVPKRTRGGKCPPSCQLWLRNPHFSPLSCNWLKGVLIFEGPNFIVQVYKRTVVSQCHKRNLDGLGYRALLAIIKWLNYLSILGHNYKSRLIARLALKIKYGGTMCGFHLFLGRVYLTDHPPKNMPAPSFILWSFLLDIIQKILEFLVF